jgi:hypothetical protein
VGNIISITVVVCVSSKVKNVQRMEDVMQKGTGESNRGSKEKPAERQV